MLKNTDLFYKNSTIFWFFCVFLNSYYTWTFLRGEKGQIWGKEGIFDTWIGEIPFFFFIFREKGITDIPTSTWPQKQVFQEENK